MRLPKKLIERVVDRILEMKVDEGDYLALEPFDKEVFRKKLIEIFKRVIELERKVHEEALKILRTNEEARKIIDSGSVEQNKALRKVKEIIAERMGVGLTKSDLINQITNEIVSLIERDEDVEIYEDYDLLRRKIRKIIKDAIEEEEEIDREVRKRIRKYSRRLVEGSREWELMYKKIYEDILIQKGLL